jgi:hypothetical protein
MSSSDRPSLAELPHHVRAGFAGLPARWRQWREGFREDPGKLWHSPVVRLAALVALGAAAVIVVYWLAREVTPRESTAESAGATQRAILFVACTNPACRAEYTTRQSLDFSAWPLTCEKCGQPAVYRATQCPACRHWFAFAPGRPPDCPFCAASKAATQPAPPARNEPTKSRDDAEDPW